MLERAAQLIAIHRDVLDARPAGGDPPEALVARGWDAFLLGLEDAALDAIEASGLWPRDTPSSLSAMIAEAHAVATLPALPEASPTRPQRGETPRKRAQIDAFSRAILPLARDRSRVIDVGSGHGHLTREIAARIDRPVIGLERDPRLAARARSLSSSPSLSFARTDVVADGLAIGADDCVIGLHACGELGDAVVDSAARSGASIALVGCCLQKRSTASRRAFAVDCELSTRLLGLSNLAPGDDGVEASRRENLLARERRLALHALLSARVGPLRHGAEIDGLNRRVAHAPLDVLVHRAFAHRGLPLPSDREIAEAARRARTQHARARRLSLPRATLARPLEVLVALDRARHLEQSGFAVEVCTVFPRTVSARNLAVLAVRAA